MNITISLQKLAEEVIKLCDEWRKENKLHVEFQFYQKHKVENFEYKNGRITQVSASFPIISKKEWNVSDIFKLIRYAQNLFTFKDCVRYLVEKYASKFSNPKAQTEFWISQFLRKTILDYLNGKFTKIF